jgi:quinol monooxygenase YgiN
MLKHTLSLVCLLLFISAGSFAQDLKKGSAMQDMKKEPAKSGVVTVIVTHEVKDYASWRKVYDADEPNRKMMGFKVWGVYADVKNPNVVSIIGTFPNAGSVDAFMSSPKLKTAMEDAGVIGKPDVKVLTATAK